MSTTITSKDLTTEYPRSPYETLGGYHWLPRMIDKARAFYAGKMGEYSPYPCGGDRAFLGAVGIDADAIGAVIKGGATDEEVLAYVKSHQAADAAQKLAEHRTQGSQPVSGEYLGYLNQGKEALAKARPELDLSQIHTFGDLICIEEGHPTADKL